MGLCDSSCASPDLVKLPTGGCTPDTLRRNSPSRLAIFTCDLTLPSPIACGGITPLFTNGDIVMTPKLSNFTWADPVTEDIVVNDCAPARPEITGRVLTFEDRNAISAPFGSPAVIDQYFDYRFYADKLANRHRIRYGQIMCNGDVYLFRDPVTGQYLEAELLLFKAYQRPQTQGAAQIEFKRGELRFATDPLLLRAPDFNLADCNIPF